MKPASMSITCTTSRLAAETHPEQMVALCPNCRAVKPRGQSREGLHDVFRQAAHNRHTEWMRKTSA